MSFILQASTALASPSYTPISASQAVIPGFLYAVDTSAGAITLTLPGSPTANSTLQFVDAKGTWGVNNLIVSPSPKAIMGVAENMVCSVNGVGFGLVYTGTEWRIF